MSELKPPKNLRQIKPRSCGFCVSFQADNGSWFCERPGGPAGDMGDRYFDWLICDRFRLDKSRLDDRGEA